MDKYDEIKYKIVNAIEFAKQIKNSPLNADAKALALKDICDILADYRIEFIGLIFGGKNNEAE